MPNAPARINRNRTTFFIYMFSEEDIIVAELETVKKRLDYIVNGIY